jgi:hypothetical protein
MRRVTTLAAAAGIALSSAAVAAPVKAGFYVIRYDNTGICQIWDQSLTFKPLRWPSDYKVVGKPVPTFAAAAAIQQKMREHHRCTI